jgi:hypothetical protein
MRSFSAAVLTVRVVTSSYLILVPGDAGGACLLDRRNMDENVRATAVRIDETVTFSRVEPLHNPHRHFPYLPKQKRTTKNEADSSAVLGQASGEKLEMKLAA